MGVKFTLIVQLAPAASEAPQVPSPAKAKSPLIVMLVIVTVALPVLVSVENCAALVVATAWLPKLNEMGDRVTVEVDAVTPEPVRATV